MVHGLPSALDERIRAQLEAERKEVEKLILELSKRKEGIMEALIELSR